MRISPGARTATRRCTSPRGAGTWRWSERLVQHGADVSRRRARRRNAAHGGRAHGQSPTSPRGCSRTARRTSCRRSSASSPRARAAIAPPPTRCSRPTRHCATELRPEHHLMLHRPAESGNAACARHDAGVRLRSDAKDKDSVTPLHRAAMGGHPEAVRVLLRTAPTSTRSTACSRRRRSCGRSRGAVNSRDQGADFVGVARLLIAAGSPLEWDAARGCAGPGAHAGRADRFAARRGRQRSGQHCRPGHIGGAARDPGQTSSTGASDRARFLHVANGTSTTDD